MKPITDRPKNRPWHQLPDNPYIEPWPKHTPTKEDMLPNYPEKPIHDIIKTDEKLIINVNVAGFKKNEIVVEVVGNVINIWTTNNGKKYMRPVNISEKLDKDLYDLDSIRTHLESGILSLIIGRINKVEVKRRIEL